MRPLIFTICVGAYTIQQWNLHHSPFLEHLIFRVIFSKNKFDRVISISGGSFYSSFESNVQPLFYPILSIGFYQIIQSKELYFPRERTNFQISFFEYFHKFYEKS